MTTLCMLRLRLKALADPARVKIMSYLFSASSSEENSGELAATLGLTSPRSVTT